MPTPSKCSAPTRFKASRRRASRPAKLLMTALALVLFAVPAGAADSPLCLLPESVVQGLSAILGSVGSQEHIDFVPEQADAVLDFVAANRQNTNLYHAGEAFPATSAYHGFDAELSFDQLLRLAFNPSIPPYALTPSSIRMSRWKNVSGDTSRFTEPWRHLMDLETPIVIRGVEHVVNTPDMFSGTYFAYDLHRTLILMKYRGQPVVISLSRQTGVSDVGKKGLVLGPDENWAYLYSGQNGLSRPGLGWIKSYMYDSYSVNIYMQSADNPGRIRCGVFKWLRAGWSSINLVTPAHIHAGLKRYESGFTSIVHNPNLPSSREMADVFSRINRFSITELRQRFQRYLSHVKSDFGQRTSFPQKWFSDWFQSAQYLDTMRKDEMQAALVIEYIRQLMGKPPCIDLSDLLPDADRLPG